MPTHSRPLGVTTLYLWPTSCWAISSPLSCVPVSSARAATQQATPAATDAASNVLTIDSSILGSGESTGALLQHMVLVHQAASMAAAPAAVRRTHGLMAARPSRRPRPR